MSACCGVSDLTLLTAFSLQERIKINSCDLHHHCSFLLRLLFNLENGCNIFFRNIWTTEVWEFESRYDQEFSPAYVVHTDSGVHSTSYPIGTGGSLPGVKQPGREADHSPTASAEVKKMWIYTSTPLYTFVA
jgi:hypothetical protein